MLGGPQPGLGCTYMSGKENEFWDSEAEKIRFIATREHSSLNLEAVSEWKLNPRTEKMMGEVQDIQKNFPYGSFLFMGPIPGFIGKGFQYGVVCFEPNIINGMQLQVWYPNDPSISVRELITIARDYYRKHSSRFFFPGGRADDDDIQDSVEILYILRTSWEESSLTGCAYEIFLPEFKPSQPVKYAPVGKSFDDWLVHCSGGVKKQASQPATT